MNDARDELFRSLIDSISPATLLEVLLTFLPVQNPSPDNLDHLPAVKSDKPGAISDVTLAKIFWPGFQAGDIATRFVLGFALRHSCARLSIGLHAATCASPDQKEPFSFSLFDRKEVQPFTDRFFQARYVPIVGFSSLGLYVFHHPVGRCRAFDAYEAAGACNRHTSEIFCDQHDSHRWWHASSEHPQTQPTMFAFYADPMNLHSFDDRELEHLLGNFWIRLAKYRKPATQLSDALARFDYESITDLRSRGPDDLRARFRALALRSHPDQGGGAVQFSSIKDAFERLRFELGD